MGILAQKDRVRLDVNQYTIESRCIVNWILKLAQILLSDVDRTSD